MNKAVVLINLGTPDQPTTAGVRAFLREFLSDRRVVEVPRLIWWIILYLIILPLRSPRVAKKYKPLWLSGDSPLRLFSRSLVDKLNKELESDAVVVTLAMTYGTPSLASELDNLLSKGVDDITFIPMFPQYSATTTAAALDVIARYFAKVRNIPRWRWVRDYHAHPAYIDTLANSVTRHWETNERGEKLLMSFHGIPQRNIELGDPYYEQCHRTASSLADKLGLDEKQWLISFQSRLGKAKWLEPYTDKLIAKLAADGVRKIDVICPAFATDCLETLEEIDTEGAEIFYENGGERFSYIACLNDSDEQVRLFKTLFMSEK